MENENKIIEFKNNTLDMLKVSKIDPADVFVILAMACIEYYLQTCEDADKEMFTSFMEDLYDLLNEEKD